MFGNVRWGNLPDLSDTTWHRTLTLSQMAELECFRAQKNPGSRQVMHCVDLIVEDGELALSHFSTAPSARLSHHPFKSDLAFPARCCVTSIAGRVLHSKILRGRGV
jgi:hypothetical protein